VSRCCGRAPALRPGDERSYQRIHEKETVMGKTILIVLASAVALLGVSSLAGASETTTSASSKLPAVIPVLGPAVSVPVGQFVKATATCPKGYFASGGGSYNGAITEIASSPTKDLRGWFVDGTNNDPLQRAFTHRADAVCVKGNPSKSALIAAAAEERLAHHAEVEFTARYATRRP
jgi:hypothetical protein